MAINWRPASLFDILCKAAADIGNLSQQNLVKFNLRDKRARRRMRAGKVTKLDLGAPDSAK